MKIRGTEVKRILINGEESKYFISSDGHVYSEGFISPMHNYIDAYGYPAITLSLNAKQHKFRIHILVAKYFLNNPDPENYHFIIFKDGNIENPDVSNLMWTDRAGRIAFNAEHGYDRANGAGSSRKTALLDEERVRQICKMMEDGKHTQTEIAEIFKVPRPVIRNIKLRKNWRHISKDYNVENCLLGRINKD